MSASLRKAVEAPEPVDVVEFAGLLVNSRRAALDLTVDQVREMAAAVLILDQQLRDTNRRMATMMLAEDAPPAPPPAKPEPAPATPARSEVVHVPLVTGGSAALTSALEDLAKARWHLEQERHSAGENLARQKFERAAIAVCNHVTPKQRT